MNLGRIYDIVLTVLRKESRGNLVKPDNFTYLLEQSHLEYYNQQYEKWAGSQTILDSLRPFVALDETITFASGEEALADLTYTYKHAIAARVTSDNTKIDIVTPSEWNEWAGDAVMKGAADYPLMTADVSKFYILPTTITSVKFSYLVQLETDTSLNKTDTATDYYLPFFDYYIDAQKNIQYLTNGQNYTLQTGEVYRDGTASGTVTGKSHELKWEDQDKINIVSILLEKIGVSLSSPEITQYAMGKEQQQNVM
jgi:hypothetical protein